MAVEASEIKKLIEDGIADSHVVIEDLRGDGEHYAAHVTSPAFEGKSRVQQHKMVYQALKGMLDQKLHALALQTSTPDKK